MRERCPALEHVIVIDGSSPGALTLADLRATGAATGDVVVAERLAGVGPHDIATIVYTSGTTGPPRGCVITHCSLLATVAMYVRELALRDGRMLIYLFLPLAHSLARVAQLATLEAGGDTGVLGRRPGQDDGGGGGGPPDPPPVRATHLGEGPLGRAQRCRRAGTGQAGALPLGRPRGRPGLGNRP